MTWNKSFLVLILVIKKLILMCDDDIKEWSTETQKLLGPNITRKIHINIELLSCDDDDQKVNCLDINQISFIEHCANISTFCRKD